jgi:hypothetical protein
VQRREILRARGLWGGAGGAEKIRAMFYFFRRGGASVRCEVRSDSEGQGYELIVDRPDAMVSVEHFIAPPDLNRRWQELERTLLREGWDGPRLRSS